MKQYSFLFESFSPLKTVLSDEPFHLYHLSDMNHNGETFNPRIPEYDDKGMGKEDNKTPRISFGSTIQDCLKSVPFRHVRRVWFVHEPLIINLNVVKKPSTDQVYDSDKTNEYWYLRPVKMKFKFMIFVTDIKNQKFVKLDSRYEPPYSLNEIIKRYGYKLAIKICGHTKNGKPDSNNSVGQNVHMWRAMTGIELVHPEPSLEEQIRVRKNWDLMNPEMKKISDLKCKEFYGFDNKTNFKKIMKEKWNQ